MEDPASEFKKLLRLHTRQAGFSSLRDLEDKTGLSRTTISHAFNPGRDLPSARTVHIIVQATKGDSMFWENQLDAAIARQPATMSVPVANNEATDEKDFGHPHVDTGHGSSTPGPFFGRYITKAAAGLAALPVVLLALMSSDHRGVVESAGEEQPTSPASPSTTAGDAELFAETAIPDNAVRTIGDPLTGEGLGVYIEASQTVQVSCRVYSAVIPSAVPDGYFYRIESSPWNGDFYAAANSFLNGDPPGDPTLYVTPTDLAVPLCSGD